MMYAAAVMAGYLDNDENGIIDFRNPKTPLTHNQTTNPNLSRYIYIYIKNYFSMFSLLSEVQR